MTNVLDHTALMHWRDTPSPSSSACCVILRRTSHSCSPDAERNFLERAFTLGEDGKLKYPELVFGAIKKSGKTTLAAIIMLATTLSSVGALLKATASPMTWSRRRVVSSQ